MDSEYFSRGEVRMSNRVRNGTSNRFRNGAQIEFETERQIEFETDVCRDAPSPRIFNFCGRRGRRLTSAGAAAPAAAVAAAKIVERTAERTKK